MIPNRQGALGFDSEDLYDLSPRTQFLSEVCGGTPGPNSTACASFLWAGSCQPPSSLQVTWVDPTSIGQCACSPL